LQSGLWKPLITFARLSSSWTSRLRMIQCESLTRTASAPASKAPPIAPLASPVMYRRQVWYSEPAGRTSSGSVTPEIPSMSTETKTFTPSLLVTEPWWRFIWRPQGNKISCIDQAVTVQWQRADGSTDTFSSRVHLVPEQRACRLLGTDPAPAP